MKCYHCGAETSNGLALCELCQRKASLDLEFLPVYFRNLARWRPGRAGSRPVPGSRVLWEGEQRAGTGDRISDRLDEAANALATWVRAVEEDRPDFRHPEMDEGIEDDPSAMVSLICAALDEHLTSVATLEWCGEFVRDLGYHEARLRELTMTSVPGWYAGACPRKVTMESACGASTYVVPGLTWVTCGSCGATTYARDHLNVVLDEARGWVARPMRIAEAIVALVDSELSVPRLHKRISKWGERGRLDPIRKVDADGDCVGPKRYRLGEVLDALFVEGATRTDDKAEVSRAAS